MYYDIDLMSAGKEIVIFVIFELLSAPFPHACFVSSLSGSMALLRLNSDCEGSCGWQIILIQIVWSAFPLFSVLSSMPNLRAALREVSCELRQVGPSPRHSES